MKNIFSGTFDQVEKMISKNFSTHVSGTIESFNVGKAIIFLIFFVGGFYGMYGIAWYASSPSGIEEAVIPLDVHNEFMGILSGSWYVHVNALLLLTTLILTLANRKKNKIKAHFIHNTGTAVFFIFFMVYAFKVFQLFVLSFPLRMIYVVFFLGCLFYVFMRSYRNAVKTVFGSEKRQSPLVEWAYANQKKIMGGLFGLFGLYQLLKVALDPDRQLRMKLTGALIELSPLGICLASLFVIFGFGQWLRGFYLYKYSEEFREKFGVEKEKWYGKNYKVS